MSNNPKLIEIFQTEKNNEDIKNIILKNITKMLTERGLLDKKNLNKNIEQLIKTKSDDNTFTIKVDYPTNPNQKMIAIKITHHKITAITKQPMINDFINKYKNMHKIIVIKDINLKAEQYITSKKENEQIIEIFKEYEFLLNIVDHVDVPKYKVYKPNSPQYQEFFEDYNTKKQQIARLQVSDPLARYYNVQVGDLVKIIKKSSTTCKSYNFRLCTK